jgi:hypothetical protein
MDRLGWRIDSLDPAKRKALYGLILAAGTLLVTLGYASEVTVQNWVEVIMQVVGVLGLLLASYNAKRLDYTGIYLAAAGLVAGLTGVGLITGGQGSQATDFMAQAVIVLPMFEAFVRTNTATPTGEPLAEWEPKHAGGVVG